MIELFCHNLPLPPGEGRGEGALTSHAHVLYPSKNTMGLTHVDATVTGPTGKSQKLELLVDSGASYSLLPTKVWKALKLKPMEKQTFTLADGTHVDRKISECRVALSVGA